MDASSALSPTAGAPRGQKNTIESNDSDCGPISLDEQPSDGNGDGDGGDAGGLGVGVLLAAVVLGLVALGGGA